MLQNLINTFEELKKYVFIINRGTQKNIIIRFSNDNFYHLVGLHKTNIDMFFPKYIKSKDKKYKFIKKNVDKFEKILSNQIQEKDSLIYRIITFPYILDLLKANNNTILYNLKKKVPGSVYDGDYGLSKIYLDEEEICCLFGLKSVNETDEYINCAPQSWMASNRINKIIEGRKQVYMKNITAIPVDIYSDPFEIVSV